MRLLIFDVDGTLVDSAAIILKAQVDTFAAHGLVHPGREVGLSVVGLTLDVALMELAGLDRPDPALTETYRQVFGALRAQAEQDPALDEPLYPGAAEALAACAAMPDTLLAIATGKSRRGAEYMIRRHGWEHLFSSVQTADDAPSKPHPAMIEQAMREAGADPSRTAMIGDSSFDMIMAVAAGAMPVGVSWGFQPVTKLAAHGARHILTRFADLPGLVDALLPGQGREQRRTVMSSAATTHPKG